jgi:hypothetical protein
MPLFARVLKRWPTLFFSYMVVLNGMAFLPGNNSDNFVSFISGVGLVVAVLGIVGCARTGPSARRVVMAALVFLVLAELIQRFGLLNDSTPIKLALGAFTVKASQIAWLHLSFIWIMTGLSLWRLRQIADGSGD